MLNMTDWELLQTYARQRSESNFEVLVTRYVALVYSAALRQVRDRQMAEEVSHVPPVALPGFDHARPCLPQELERPGVEPTPNLQP